MIQTLFGSSEQKPGLFERMKEAGSRTRENLSERIEEAVGVRKEIDRNALDDLEGTLIGADLGAATTHQVLEKVRGPAHRKQSKDVDELRRLRWCMTPGKRRMRATLTASWWTRRGVCIRRRI